MRKKKNIIYQKNANEKFIEIAKRIINKGSFSLKETKNKEDLIDIIDVFLRKRDTFFYDPKTGIISPNSRIYLKAMEDFVQK